MLTGSITVVVQTNHYAMVMLRSPRNREINWPSDCAYPIAPRRDPIPLLEFDLLTTAVFAIFHPAWLGVRAWNRCDETKEGVLSNMSMVVANAV
mmetsp:Transcript_18991/g.52981  ORF Transcript_18991/g.52981 Transcript_18991/m.52981 type:complete len:94 (+) Transcript_18991:113-394(+)